MASSAAELESLIASSSVEAAGDRIAAAIGKPGRRDPRSGGGGRRVAGSDASR